MKLWCFLCFNEEEEEEEERRNLAEPMKNEEVILGNVADDDEAEAETRNDEARFLDQVGRISPLHAPRRLEGESSSGGSLAVAADILESLAADESRDSSHKRAKFYK